MGSILDITFKPYIQRQLNTRQELLKQESRDSRFMQYTTAKNSWCRMTSLVNYDSPDGKYKGDQLSRKYVLEGGTLFPSPSDPKKFALRRGVTGNAGSYGALGDGSYGIRPMPGIMSIDLKNRGALGSTKEAVVKFMAWDKGQLEDLEILFMRVGYSVIIEFGWSLFLDTFVNDASSDSFKVVDQLPLSQVKMRNFIEPTINAFDATLTPPDLYARFEYLRHKFSGNYEGMAGKIRNFSFTQLENGGYECTATIIAISDVLDSFKINSSTYPLGNSGQDNSPKTNGRLLTRFEQIFLPITDLSNATAERAYILDNVIGSNLSKYQKIPQNGDLDPNIDFGVYTIPFNSVPSTLLSEGRKNLQGALHYISMGSFIAIMNTQFGLYDPRQGQNVPLVELEVPYPGYGSYGNGLCICSEDTISIDPTICLINNPNAKFVVDGTNGFSPNVSQHNKVQGFLNPFSYKGAKNLGIIANIYLCVETIVDKFRAMSGASTGTVDTHKFIQSILDDVGYSLGSVNEFGFYADDSTATIIDAHFVEDPSLAKNKRFTMNYIGTNHTVRNFNIVSKIFQSQATMVAIGAGVRANIAGVQTSTYNLLNQGLTDRLVLQTLDADAVSSLSSTNGATQEDQDKAYRQKLAQMVLDLRAYVQSYIQKGDLSQVLANKPAANSNLNSVIVKINTDTNFKALIPISLELTVDGISGIVIGNVFRLNTDSLPKDYVNKNIAFRVVGLTQNIAGSDWTTTIVTQCCLLGGDDQQELNTLDKTAINNAITGIIQAQVLQAQQDLQKQVYIYNNLVKLIASIFGPNNPEALVSVNKLIGITNLYQPGSTAAVNFTFDFKLGQPWTNRVPSNDIMTSILQNVNYSSPSVKYSMDSVSFAGYPPEVVKNFMVQNAPTFDFAAKVQIKTKELSNGVLTASAKQYVLNPFGNEYLVAGTFITTLIKNYPDYGLITNDILKQKILQAQVDINNSLVRPDGGNITIPIMYLPGGQGNPAEYQKIFIDTHFSSTDKF